MVAAGETYTNALVVEVQGTPLSADLAHLLVSGFVDDSRVLPDMFLLRFRDPDHIVLAKAGISVGVPVKLFARAGDDSAPQLLLSGEVTALELEMDATGTFTLVRGLDHSHRLFRGRRVESYRQMTVSDIVRKVGQRAGLQIGQIDSTPAVLEQVAQPNVTDWEFLRALADDAGAEFAVVDGKLEFRAPTQASGAPAPGTSTSQSPVVLEMGRNLLKCRVSVTSAEQVHNVEVRGWDVDAKQTVIGRAPADKVDTLALGTTPADLIRPFGEADFVVADTPYGTQGEVDSAAKALAATIASSFAELEGVAMGNPRLRAGTAVTLSNVGQPFEGRYTLGSSRHVFDPATGYTSWVTVSGRQERSLFGLTSGAPARNPRVFGLRIATVTDTKDPKSQGRVKLRFPWLSDQYVTDWARTAQLGGKGGGGVFSPEVGDEVLVGFEQGSINRPYVIAGLYNGVDKPSEHEVALIDGTSGAVNRRTFVSRTGNRVELLDTANGPKGVRLATGDGKLTLNLDQKATSIVVHSDGTVTVEAKDKITVTAQQGISVNAGQGKLELAGDAVSVTARNGVAIDGGAGQVKVGTTGSVDVQGSKVGLNGTASTEVKGGANCSISAALVRIN